METIALPGYTHEEKHHIARHHLVPKQLKEHGLSPEILQITSDALKSLVSKYTREAGVRNLERKIGAVCRAVAVKVVEKQKAMTANQEEMTKRLEQRDPLAEDLEDQTMFEGTLVHPPELPIVVDDTALEDILGPPLYENELYSRLRMPGVALGLAWTASGGEIMFVEATKMEGDGQLTLTGQLGDVMKESAKIALNWVRTHVHEYAIPIINATDLMENTDVHIHFPAGAVGKDGPSAGITIVTALVSLFTGRIVGPDLAMTGEMTLRGLVLPVGGVKSKVLAAHRMGIRRIIIPKRNEKDLQDIPQSVKTDLTFHLVTHVDEVLQASFEGGFDILSDPKFDQTIASKL
jgi:ATP-dependent Lon protease